jgi:mannose-6-phosphate isomerase
MANTAKIFRLHGKVQHYAWGGSVFIPALLGQSNNDNKPFAEYWMGAHDNVPSEIEISGNERKPLNAFIKTNPVEILGASVHKRFGRLPYLFKVQDVKDMLSIQVHPNKKAAEQAFAAENLKGSALNAPDRNYKDDNHKPELFLALTDFWLLHGFKPVAAMQHILQQTPELQFLSPVFNSGDYTALYKAVMQMEQQEVNKKLQSLVDRIVPLYEKTMLNKSREDFWAARASKTFNAGGNIDRGIFSIYLFNIVNLQPGDAIFQDAGIPHAYLEGQGMEIMANSDNVLRGGLTPKHIDVSELLKHVRFEAVEPNIIKGTDSPVIGDELFYTSAADFELHRIILQKGTQLILTATTAEIYFIYKGSIEAGSGNDTLNLDSGESMLAIAGATISLSGVEDAIIFRATVPQGIQD